MVGIQIPILVGIFEYGVLLLMKKYPTGQSTWIIKVGDHKLKKNVNKYDMDDFTRKVDKWTFIGSFIFIVIFNFLYWSLAKSL